MAEREQIVQADEDGVPVITTCQLLGISKPTYYLALSKSKVAHGHNRRKRVVIPERYSETCGRGDRLLEVVYRAIEAWENVSLEWRAYEQRQEVEA